MSVPNMPRRMGAALAAVAISIAAPAAAFAQSASSQTYNTPLGPITHTQTTANVGNGTVTTHTVVPGNNSSITPYVGAITYDTDPNRTQSSTAVQAGISIPLGSLPRSAPSPATSPTPTDSGGSFEPDSDSP